MQREKPPKIVELGISSERLTEFIDLINNYIRKLHSYSYTISIGVKWGRDVYPFTTLLNQGDEKIPIILYKKIGARYTQEAGKLVKEPVYEITISRTGTEIGHFWIRKNKSSIVNIFCQPDLVANVYIFDIEAAVEDFVFGIKLIINEK
jgi:hypothetical protein